MLCDKETLGPYFLTTTALRLPRGRYDMEEKPQSRSCVCEGREYANQERVCQKDSCYICHDGSWESYNTLFVL